MALLIPRGAALPVAEGELPEVERAAEAGDPDAQTRLGWHYFGPSGGSTGVEASLWFRRAAEQGNVEAACMLGVCLTGGEGIAEDRSEALVWFKKAADAGHAQAELLLAWCYRHGRGVTVDLASAAAWCRRAAEHGNATAQLSLGCMYRDGTGLPKSPDLAAEWMKKAADQGDAAAQGALGAWYQTAAGGRNYEEAARYFRLAAAQGDAYAAHAVRKLPFNRHPLLRQRYRVQTVVGYLFLGWYAHTTRFSVTIGFVALVLGCAVAAGILVSALVLLLSNRKRLDGELNEMEAHEQRLEGRRAIASALLRVLFYVPPEDGFFLVPVLWLGVTPWFAALACALFAISHYPKFTWRFCVFKGVLWFPVVLLGLPYGIWTVMACHLLIDFSMLGFRLALQPQRG